MSDDLKHLWEYEHAYYCNDANYFNNECFTNYDSFDEFLDEWGGDTDIDYNLIFRWDWKIYPSDETESGEEEDYLHIYRILQRKGIFQGQIIKITKDDEPKIKEYLSLYKPTILSFWDGV